MPGLVADFLKDSADIIGLSCMANLLPFTILTAGELKERHPEKTIIIGGVGPKSVEKRLLERFPFIDFIAHGEGEVSGVALIQALTEKKSLHDVPGVCFRDNGTVVMNPAAERIRNLDAIPLPAFDHIEVTKYAGHGMISSRGCPYPCTFCSVAPIWGRTPYFRSSGHIVDEMRMLHDRYGVDLFLFQDEFFVASKERVLDFCRVLSASGLKIRYKAFGRVNITDGETMRALASTGCIEIRYGIESGSDRVLQRTRKGFSSSDSVAIVSEATMIFPRVDTFFIWGFPFETIEDFNQSIFQMISFRLMGARILPSLLCLLPQTDIYEEYRESAELEFCPDLFPEYMVTGHELCDDGRLQLLPEYSHIFDFIASNRDIFPGFFHIGIDRNILPKFRMLKEHGFYPSREKEVKKTDSCGAHSPKISSEQVLGAITHPE
jgi:radical SAM superfamily enzyme YgiQ (UPF0313 family)